MKRQRQLTRWKLFFFDLAFFLITSFLIFVLYPTTIDDLNATEAIIYTVFAAVCIFVPRFLISIYNRIWRYAGSSDYLWLVVADFIGGVFFMLLREFISPVKITFVRAISLVLLNLLGKAPKPNARSCAFSSLYQA